MRNKVMTAAHDTDHLFRRRGRDHINMRQAGNMDYRITHVIIRHIVLEFSIDGICSFSTNLAGLILDIKIDSIFYVIVRLGRFVVLGVCKRGVNGEDRKSVV